MGEEETVTLYDQEGSTSVYILARVDPKGSLLVEGQDLGELPQEVFGDREYEYTVIVKATEKDRLLLLLLKELFGGDSSAVTRFRKWLEANGIPYEFQTF